MPNSSDEVKGVISDGITYAGIRKIHPSVGEFTWYDLTDGDPKGSYPTNACSVSVGDHANGTSIQVLTTTGKVYETVCTVNPNTDTLACDEVWTPLTSPSPGDLKRRFGLSGADPNHLPKKPKANPKENPKPKRS
ncbi:hypothetical protein ACIRSU_33550 [Streptomyces sp. NPDC101160]|uniref:hypothetical protein n=1 Tax=Streptomyces sp. NPDC101160 TaxID=3366118 RepID=UPI003804B32C